MANPPPFVPRDFLEVPEFFGVHEDVTWHLAKDYAVAAGGQLWSSDHVRRGSRVEQR